jgi:hypothetical protein
MAGIDSSWFTVALDGLIGLKYAVMVFVGGGSDGGGANRAVGLDDFGC